MKQVLDETSAQQLSDELKKRGAKQVMVPIQFKGRKDAFIRHVSVKGADLTGPGLQRGDVQADRVEVPVVGDNAAVEDVDFDRPAPR